MHNLRRPGISKQYTWQGTKCFAYGWQAWWHTGMHGKYQIPLSHADMPPNMSTPRNCPLLCSRRIPSIIESNGRPASLPLSAPSSLLTPWRSTSLLVTLVKSTCTTLGASVQACDATFLAFLDNLRGPGIRILTEDKTEFEQYFNPLKNPMVVRYMKIWTLLSTKI